MAMSRPKRLIHKDGQWMLELERYHTDDGTVFRPKQLIIEGTEAILSCLEQEAANKTVVSSARSLFNQPPASTSSTSYTIESDRWVKLDESGNTAEGWRSSDEVQRLEKRLSALERIVSRLVDSFQKTQSSQETKANQELSSRLAALEEAIATGVILRSGPESLEELGTASDEGRTDESEDAESSTAASTPSAEDDSAVQFKPIKAFPKNRAIESLLTMLVGNTIALKNATQGPSSPEDYEGFFCSRLVGDNQETNGLVMTDMVASIYLGGWLMMLPDASLAEQVKTNSPSEDVLDAMSEVFNNLGSLFNDIKSNPHVHATAVEPLDPQQFDWLLAPSSQRTLIMAANGGRIVMLAR